MYGATAPGNRFFIMTCVEMCPREHRDENKEAAILRIQLERSLELDNSFLRISQKKRMYLRTIAIHPGVVRVELE